MANLRETQRGGVGVSYVLKIQREIHKVRLPGLEKQFHLFSQRCGSYFIQDKHKGIMLVKGTFTFKCHITVISYYPIRSEQTPSMKQAQMA